MLSCHDTGTGLERSGLSTGLIHDDDKTDHRLRLVPQSGLV